ncbi:outer membrane beta-barrel protein [Kaarinaea lacus]
MKQIFTAGILGGAVCLAIVLDASTPVLAAAHSNVSPSHRMGTNLTSNFYIGANLNPTNSGFSGSGYSRLGFSSKSDTQLQEFDASTTGYGLFGGYYINDVLAIDVSWTDLGEATDPNTTVDTSLLQLGMQGKVPVRSDLMLYGRVGVNMWNYDINAPSYDFENNADAYFGIGADYNIKGRPAFRFGLDFYSLDLDLSNGNFLDKDKISEFSIGIMFNP